MNNNINDILNELDEMLASEQDRKIKAEDAIRRAEELRAAAIQEQAKAAANVAAAASLKKQIEDSRRPVEDGTYSINYHPERAIVSTNDGSYRYGRTGERTYVAPERTYVAPERTYVAPERTATTNTRTNTRTVNKTTNKGSNNNFVKGFVSCALAVALLGGCGYALSRDSKTGQVRAASWFNTDNNYKFDYSGNVVTVNGEGYETLTTEKFEALVTDAIKKFESIGLSVKKEDVVKFITVFNIDKLKQDNRELAAKIIGDQAVVEVFDDAYKVSNVIAEYEARNLIANGQIFSVADFVFDKEQRQLVKDFEARKLAIIQANQSNRESMLEQLCLDIYDATGEFAKFEDASKMLMFRHALVVLHSTYFTDCNTWKSTLTGNARNLIFRLIAPYGASQEEIINSIMSGLERNMMASYAECLQNPKTLKK